MKTGRVMIYSALGREVRDFLGDPSKRLRYPERGGATFGGPRVLAHRNRGYQFLKVPYPRCPPVANFELLVAKASALPQIVHLNDQRLFDAGLAAEFVLQVQKSCAVPLVDRALL